MTQGKHLPRAHNHAAPGDLLLLVLSRATAVILASSGPRGYFRSATKLPLFPPCFSSNRTDSITIPRSTALHMS